MSSDAVPLPHTIGDREVFKRVHAKADGRTLRLYGYAPHREAALPEQADAVAKGGELRRHPLRGEWNLYAPHRQNRTFKPSAADDPLAPTRPGAPATEIPFTDFELAVFDNKFTSLHPEAPAPQDIAGLESGVARGACEVVVYGPEAEGDLHAIGQDKRRLLLAAWIDRYAELFARGNRFVMPFENRGDAVGVTLHHPHGQIYAFPFVPAVQQKAADAFANGYDLAADLSRGDYRVAEAGGVVATCPPFARFPFEVWVAPARRVAGPWEMTEDEQDGFAHLLGDVTRRYDATFGQATPVMLSLQAAPVGTEDSWGTEGNWGTEGSWHFHAQFQPLMRAPGRLKYLASVEQATGVFTVDVMPEFAAQTLRRSEGEDAVKGRTQ